MDEESLREEGREIARAIQARIAANKQQGFEEWKEHCRGKATHFRGYAKKANTQPPDLISFIASAIVLGYGNHLSGRTERSSS